MSYDAVGSTGSDSVRTITVADIGINANADINIAKRLIDVAMSAGVDYVKFQKRTPELCIPEDQKNIMKDTPWGRMTYLDYKDKMEFSKKEYDSIAGYCEFKGMKFFFSVWDEESVVFASRYDSDFIKIPSACITDEGLMLKCRKMGTPLIMSTGACNFETIDLALCIFNSPAYILHCVSTYPSKPEEQNLSAILTMKDRYPFSKIGFSNHYPGIIYIPIAITLGAEMVEWHITLDRSMWGTDQAASIEPEGTFKIMKYIRDIEAAMGSGEKTILEREMPIMAKLRRYAA